MSHVAYLAALRAKSAYKRERKEEIEVIAEEALLVGFTAKGIYYGGEGCDNSFEIVTPSGKTMHTCWYVRAPPAWYASDPADVEQLSQEQLVFLAWSADWQHVIWPYWRGKTEHSDIHALIAHMKERDIQPVLGPSDRPDGLVWNMAWDQDTE